MQALINLSHDIESLLQLIDMPMIFFIPDPKNIGSEMNSTGMEWKDMVNRFRIFKKVYQLWLKQGRMIVVVLVYLH